MLNRVQLLGNVGREPEARYTASGKAVTTFSVATSQKYQDKEQTEWHSCVTWEKLAELCAQYVTKGMRVYVEGRIATRQWEDKGQKHYRTEIVADKVLFLDRAKNDGTAPPADFRVPAGNDLDPDDLPFEF